MKNPVLANAESIKTGKDLWMRNYQSCHGKSGHGDGTKAAQLKTEPGTFHCLKTKSNLMDTRFIKYLMVEKIFQVLRKKFRTQKIFGVLLIT